MNADARFFADVAARGVSASTQKPASASVKKTATPSAKFNEASTALKEAIEAFKKANEELEKVAALEELHRKCLTALDAWTILEPGQVERAKYGDLNPKALKRALDKLLEEAKKAKVSS